MGRIYDMERLKRDSIDIVASILRALMAYGKVKITRISYYAELPYPRVKKYMQLLLFSGLVGIEMQNQVKYYRITSKGLKFLSLYDHLSELLPKISANLPAYINENTNRKIFFIECDPKS